ncbi:MAG TPA: N(4)-(beta-N-acetylglucosaminyl)-L-asparaginase [Gemmatimonadales bacterium]|nr:N(4)-(beta-N-acetylglucosaminyl)-L-asparaginase [Gemmatimonadales bacterium]
MSDTLDRRSFLGTVALAVAGSSQPGAAVPVPTAASPILPGAPWVRRSRAAKFAAVASANGIRGVKLAVELMQKGTDTLDAAVEGVKIQELDPEDDSVGYGGLPNEDGVVQLDASCVHGPTRRAGAVAALEGIKTPSEVARLVLKYTDHILLVGEGAKRFALSYGFKEEDLLTPRSREKWLRWRANRGKGDDWVDIPEGAPALARPTGTINLDLINDKGEISSITTTSGLAWKIPGRAGDSPIVGAGQYTDNEIGAAGSTGLGELNIMVCGGFLTVEHMRRGMSPTDACLATLKRVVAMCPDSRRDAQGRPPQITFYALNKKGEYGAASLFPGKYAASDEANGARTLDAAHVYEAQRP